jgi:predicted RNA-binding Zn ribbon-like protein
MVSEVKMLPSVLRERPAGQTKLVAGRLCLDFANSVGGWPAGAALGQATARDDRLTDYADLLAWSWQSGLLEEKGVAQLLRLAEQRPREAATVQERARRLRDAVYAIAWSLEHGHAPRPTHLQALSDEVRLARGRQRLASSAGKLAWQLEDEPKALDAPLWHIALSAESYFTTGDLTRLHSCPGEDCGWLFEDQTRNRSRQWCDMGDCGNVAKVRRFRSRQARKTRARRAPARK